MVDEDDKLPQHICIDCCTKLQTVCDFIDTVHKSQEELLNRRHVLDHTATDDSYIDYTKQEIKEETESYSDDEGKHTGMEVHVDPMMVLENSDGPFLPTSDDHTETMNSEECEDVTYLHRVDSDKVTIKLIRKADSSITKSAGDNNTKLVSCDICKMRFKSDVALKKHLQFHLNETSSETQFKCDTCYKEFGVKTDLVQHLKDHNSKGMCQLCGRMFRSEKTYSAHMDEHLSDTSHACEVCGRSYSTEGHLKTHSVTHSTERPYHCNFCDKKFKRNQDLKFHTNQHTGNKPYQCPFCDKCFASSGNCYSHRNRIHPDRNKSVPLRFSQRKDNQGLLALAPKPALTTVKGIFKYQCQLCDHSFMKRDNFTYHMYQHTGEKPFQCTFCTEKFMTRRGLLLHHDKIHPTQDRPLALLTKNVLLK